jgi:leucyl aminopeptidase
MSKIIQFFARSAKLSSVLSNFHVKDEWANLILPLFKGEPLSGFAKEADELTGGMIARRVAADGFDAALKRVQVIDFNLDPKLAPGLDKVILVGLGARSKLTVAGLRKALESAFEQSRDTAKSTNVIFPLGDVDLRGLSMSDFAEVVAEYATLIDYEVPHKRTKEREDESAPVHLETLTVITSSGSLSAARNGLVLGNALGTATNKARDLVNLPSTECTPEFLGKHARAIANANKARLSCKVLDQAAMEKLGMNGALAVSRAAEYPPVLIEMTYTPPRANADTPVIGFIGKGITLDTGGLSIKDATNMRHMKNDMAGGAAVLSVMEILPLLKPGCIVKAVVVACENLTGEGSYRPGEIIKTMSGQTVEIGDCDAEGRMTLCDALHYMQEVLGVHRIVDLATLTGAVEDALGDTISGAFGNNAQFTRKFLRASEEAGEQMHECPLSEDHRKGNHSEMADLTNDGEGPGHIIAALFLSEFVNEGTQWVHVDIAATSYRLHAWGVDPIGATGVGVRTLARLALATE